MSKFFSTVLTVALFTALFAGCGGDVEETYIMTTLHEAAGKDLLSPGFKYGFDSPNIVAAHKNLALAREGNIIEFFAGDGLESKLAQVGGRRYTMGVVKRFTPRHYFAVDFLTAGSDTIAVGEPYEVIFPVVMRQTDEENFKEVNLADLTPNTLKLKEIFDSKFLVKNAKITHEEIEWLGETRMAFVIHLENVKFIIDEDNDQMNLMLKALVNEHLFFDGGVTFGARGDLPSRSYRDSTKIAGKVTIDFLRYAGQVIVKPV
ncbi:MAG: hypothetical protein JW876_11235 [Candidatus Krumholzibacteriota bacterium]|nr:hypothetical protein [Candidatus Krumholzibacteriota bacterium]